MEVTIEQLRRDENEKNSGDSMEVKELRARLYSKEKQLKYCLGTLKIAKALIDSALEDLKLLAKE